MVYAGVVTFNGTPGIPLIKPEALSRVERLTRIRTFEVQMAGVTDGRAFHNPSAGARRIFETAAYFSAPKVYIRFEIPRRRGRDQDMPTLRNIIPAVRFLHRTAQNSEDVEKLIVSGEEGDDRAEAVINLLEDHLVESVPIELLGGERISDAKRLNAVTTAWNIHREAIERAYTVRT